MQRAWRAQPRAEPLVYRSKRRTSADASSAIASGIASTGKVVFLRAATGLQWPIHAYMRNCIFNLKTKKINSSKHLSFLETPSRSMASDAEMLMAVEERFDPHPRLPISRRDDVAGRRRAFLPRGATVGILCGSHAIYGEVSFWRHRLHGGDAVGVAPRIVAVIRVVVEKNCGDAREAVRHDATDEQGFLSPRGPSGVPDIRQSSFHCC